jgi:hypothetical protein
MADLCIINGLFSACFLLLLKDTFHPQLIRTTSGYFVFAATDDKGAKSSTNNGS